MIIVIAVVCTILLSACGATQSRSHVAIDRIELTLSAASGLNGFDNRSHALHLRFIQLDDIEMLQRAMQNYGALIAMMEKNFSHEHVVGITDLMLRPSSRSRVTLKSEPAAAYLAVLAGYYQPASLSAMVLVFPLQITGRRLSADVESVSLQYHLKLHFSADAMELQSAGKE